MASVRYLTKRAVLFMNLIDTLSWLHGIFLISFTLTVCWLNIMDYQSFMYVLIYSYNPIILNEYINHYIILYKYINYYI